MLDSGTHALLPTLMTMSEDFLQMSNAESTAEPAALAGLSGVGAPTIAPGYSFADAGEAPAGRRMANQLITGLDLRTVSNDGPWRIVDDNSVADSGSETIRSGDSPGGEALTFETVRPADQSDDHAGDADVDPGLARAGAAAAARRRELDISQRSLAADGIINAGALIAFEKGRSWPRERTRAKLEEVLQWPAGTISRIRDGAAAANQAPDRLATPVVTKTEPDVTPEPNAAADGPASLIAQAVAAAVDTCSLAIAALPSPEDPDFNDRAAPILADLRQLEAIAVQATRISRITPELIKALGSVRRYHDKLMTIGATAPGATLAQRLYAARRRANLSASETAQAVGVSEEIIVKAEAEEALPPEVAAAIEALISQIN